MRRFEVGMCVRIQHATSDSSSKRKRDATSASDVADEDAWLAVIDDAWRDSYARNIVKLRW